MNRTSNQVEKLRESACGADQSGPHHVTESEGRRVERHVNRPRAVSTWSLMGALAIASGCGDDPVAPTDDGLRLTVEASPREIHPGEVGSILIRLQNLRPVGVTLSFSSTCQLLTYVQGVDNSYEYPPMGGYGCGDAITTLSLLPYEQRTEIFYVHAMSWYRHTPSADVARIWLPGLALERGRYAARVELGHNYDGTSLRSRSVSFEVR